MRVSNLIILVQLTAFIILHSVAVSQNVWYINNSIGNDMRNGLSPTIPTPDDSITGPKKTLSGKSVGTIAASNSGDTIYISCTGLDYDTVSGELPIIEVNRNLTFKAIDGEIIFGSILQVNDTLPAPENAVIFDSGNFLLSKGLSLINGTLSVGNKLTITDNSLITVDAGSVVEVGIGDIIYGNGISVQYIPSVKDYISSGTELPLTVKNLTFTRSKDVTNRVTTLNSPVTVTDSLIIRNDLTVSPLAPITLNGDLIISNDIYANASQPNILFNSTIIFTGLKNTIITVPSSVIPQALGNIKIDKTDSITKVTLVGGNIATGTITFMKGNLITDTSIIYIPAPTLIQINSGAVSQGFTGAGPNSMIVGNVAKQFINTGFISTSTESANIFPVGTGTIYRPLMLTFNPTNNVPVTPNAKIVVSHINSYPGGVRGLPIEDGIRPNVDISRYPSFYWRIYTIGQVSPSIEFNLSLSDGNYTNYYAPADVRIIRRHGNVEDVNNDWLLQGESTEYENTIITSSDFSRFEAVCKNSVGGLRTGGVIFTYGMESKIIPVICPLPDVNFRSVGSIFIPDPYKLPLADKFTNYTGTLTYTVSSTNPAIASVEVVRDTLLVTAHKDGSAIITIKATDSNNDFAICSFAVRGCTTCLDNIEAGAKLPKEFVLYQNYPNPLNPSTNIIFNIPQSSGVKIAIYDILGREIEILVEDNYLPGYYAVQFNGSKLSSGTYYCRLIATLLNGDRRTFIETKKLTLIK